MLPDYYTKPAIGLNVIGIENKIRSFYQESTFGRLLHLLQDFFFWVRSHL
jgi:hypothetical protein